MCSWFSVPLIFFSVRTRCVLKDNQGENSYQLSCAIWTGTCWSCVPWSVIKCCSYLTINPQRSASGPQLQRALTDKDKMDLYLAIRIVLIGHPANGVDISSLFVSFSCCWACCAALDHATDCGMLNSSDQSEHKPLFLKGSTPKPLLLEVWGVCLCRVLTMGRSTERLSGFSVMPPTIEAE